jgi:hypothetical protein
MRKLFWIIFFCCSFSLENFAQNYFDISGGIQSIQQSAWNETIQTYNFNRVWLKEKMPDLRNSANVGIGYSGVLASGLFFSPSVTYSSFKSSAENGNFRSFVRLR